MHDNLTENERELLKKIRSLEAFERIEIVADKGGKPDNYIIYRSHKIILDDDNIPKPAK